jgi:hypothetical protein
MTHAAPAGPYQWDFSRTDSERFKIAFTIENSDGTAFDYTLFRIDYRLLDECGATVLDLSTATTGITIALQVATVDAGVALDAGRYTQFCRIARIATGEQESIFAGTVSIGCGGFGSSTPLIGAAGSGPSSPVVRRNGASAVKLKTVPGTPGPVGAAGPVLTPNRAATASASLAVTDVNRSVLGDLNVLGIVARTLPDGTTLAPGSTIRVMKDYRRAEGRLEIYPYSGQTVCNQTSLKFTRDGQAADLMWDATTLDWKMVGQSFAAFRNTLFTQEHDYTATSSLATPSTWSWDENGSRYSQSNTTTGDQVFRIDNIVNGALKTASGASFVPLHAGAEKVSDDRNKVVYYAAVGESFAHGASTHPGFVLEKPYQTHVFHTMGVENETLWTHDPHEGVCEVRLSITNGDPWPTSAVAATNLLWLVADKGDRISIPNTTADGTTRITHTRHISDPAWGSSIVRDISDGTYGYTAQANSKHNVFAYIWSDGRVVLVLGTAGASDASELERGPDGFLVNKVGLAGGAGIQAGAARYLGHIYTDSASKIVWPGVGNLTLPTAPIKVGVRNLYNRRKLILSWSDASASSYTYTSGTWRLMNGNTNALVQFAQGKDDGELRLRTQNLGSGASGSIAAVAPGLDAVAPPTGGVMGMASSGRATIAGEFTGYPSSGTHTAGPYESSLVGGTATFEPLSTAGIASFRFEGEF